MKKGLILLLFAIISSSVTVFAQDSKVKKDKPTKEERVDMMTKKMSSTLMLNDAQNAKFAPLYKKYLSDMQALRPQRDGKNAQMDDAQRDKIIKEGFAHQRKMIDLKEKYYNDFSKFLTPSQAQKIIGPMNGGMDKGHMKDGKMKKGDKMMKNHDVNKDGKRDRGMMD